MSRHFNVKVECLGTTLEWDCGESLANSVVGGITVELEKVCRDNEREGQGFCGNIHYKMEGLAAFQHVGKLASALFTAGAIGKAVLIREFIDEYIEVMSASQHICEIMDCDMGSTTTRLVKVVLDKVALLGYEQAMMPVMSDLWHYTLIDVTVRQPQVEAAFAEENWALSITVSASR